MRIEEASLADLAAAMDRGAASAVELVDAYADRIAAYDRAGPGLSSVRELNSDARAIAAERDADRAAGRVRGPLHGIPILLKDNIATADRLTTSAGSLALAGVRARHDAFVAQALRAAGAVILGKANMTEFANFTTIGMPSGYSALGGQVLNPYAPELDDDGMPIVSCGGSSSGSAVAVAANLAAAAIGTETSASLLSPAGANGLVTVKPTVGLVSRAGIIPISASQDVAGPLTRCVRDAALLLGAIAGHDADDPVTAAAGHGADYLGALDAASLQGARIGVPQASGDADDRFYGALDADLAQIMAQTIALLAAQGAAIVTAPIVGAARVGGPPSMIAVPVTNRFSPLAGSSHPVSAVMLHEFADGLAAYLRRYAPDQPLRSLDDIVACYRSLGEPALRYGQDLLLAAAATGGDLTAPAYLDARRYDLETARDGLDAYFDRHRLDAVLFPGHSGAAICARAGYPSVMVPAGFTTSIGGRPTPPCPVGVTFAGRAFSEARLLGLAYAFEQASRLRRPPATAPRRPRLVDAGAKAPAGQ